MISFTVYERRRSYLRLIKLTQLSRFYRLTVKLRLKSQVMRVVILHLDLGIGGAEQLVVNVATILKRDLQCNVTLLTSHHDEGHCFEATRYDNGKLN